MKSYVNTTFTSIGLHYSQQNTNHTATLTSTLHLRSSNRSHIEVLSFFSSVYSACIEKCNLDSSPSCDSHACSVTSVSCAAAHFIHLLTAHTHFLCVLVCCGACSHVSQESTEPRTWRDSGSADYKARSVGELRMSTDSDLPPKPLWPSNSSARESSSAQENVNTDR